MSVRRLETSPAEIMRFYRCVGCANLGVSVNPPDTENANIGRLRHLIIESVVDWNQRNPDESIQSLAHSHVGDNKALYLAVMAMGPQLQEKIVEELEDFKRFWRETNLRPNPSACSEVPYIIKVDCGSLGEAKIRGTCDIRAIRKQKIVIDLKGKIDQVGVSHAVQLACATLGFKEDVSVLYDIEQRMAHYESGSLVKKRRKEMLSLLRQIVYNIEFLKDKKYSTHKCTSTRRGRQMSFKEFFENPYIGKNPEQDNKANEIASLVESLLGMNEWKLFWTGKNRVGGL
jgi:hypothetical protein